MSSNIEASGVACGQLVAGEVSIGLGGYGDRGSGGGEIVGGGGGRQDGDGCGQLIRWEDTVANAILGTEPNDPLVYAPVLELHLPIFIIIVEYGGQLEK